MAEKGPRPRRRGKSSQDSKLETEQGLSDSSSGSSVANNSGEGSKDQRPSKNHRFDIASGRVSCGPNGNSMVNALEPRETPKRPVENQGSTGKDWRKLKRWDDMLQAGEWEREELPSSAQEDASPSAAVNAPAVPETLSKKNVAEELPPSVLEAVEFFNHSDVLDELNWDEIDDLPEVPEPDHPDSDVQFIKEVRKVEQQTESEVQFIREVRKVEHKAELGTQAIGGVRSYGNRFSELEIGAIRNEIEIQSELNLPGRTYIDLDCPEPTAPIQLVPYPYSGTHSFINSAAMMPEPLDGGVNQSGSQFFNLHFE